MDRAPPRIFSKRRKYARTARAQALTARSNGAHNNTTRNDGGLFLLDDIADDIAERLGFVRFDGRDVLIEGFDAGALAAAGVLPPGSVISRAGDDFDRPAPFTAASFDLVISINSLDTVNDLPGALIQMRELLRPGGLAIATFIGGMSLLKLRRAMLDAQPERPAARMHPLVDPRSCAQLLQRARWRDPVVDSHVLTARYASLPRLVTDLREHAMGAALAAHAPALGKADYARAQSAFIAQADDDAKVSETFEIITLTGRN